MQRANDQFGCVRHVSTVVSHLVGLQIIRLLHRLKSIKPLLVIAHLRQRDVSFVVVSRAPLAKIEAFKRRMGWRFPWVSSAPSDFNYDYQASFRPEDIRP